MATKKKTPAKKKENPHPTCTPMGIVMACMPLKAFVESMQQDWVNPFYAGREYHTAFCSYDVFQGWIVDRSYDSAKNENEVDWICPMPEGYSVVDLLTIFNEREKHVPVGKWIGPTHIMKALAEHNDLCFRHLSKAISTAFDRNWPDFEEPKKKVFPNGEFRSEIGCD